MEIIRKGFITFKKDFYIAKSYPVRFLILLFEIFFQLAILFFFAKFLESSFLQSAVINIENFFAYFLLGICVLDVSNTIVSYLSIQVEEYKKTGVFEELFILPVDSTNLLILSSAFPIFLSSRCWARTITLNFVINGIRWCGGAIAIGILYFFDIFCEIFASLTILSPDISS